MWQQSRVYIAAITYQCGSCHVCMWQQSLVYVAAVTFVCGSSHVCMWQQTRLYVAAVTFVCGSSHVCMWQQTRLYVAAVTFVCGRCMWYQATSRHVLHRNGSQDMIEQPSNCKGSTGISSQLPRHIHRVVWDVIFASNMPVVVQQHK